MLLILQHIQTLSHWISQRCVVTVLRDWDRDTQVNLFWARAALTNIGPRRSNEKLGFAPLSFHLHQQAKRQPFGHNLEPFTKHLFSHHSWFLIHTLCSAWSWGYQNRKESCCSGFFFFFFSSSSVRSCFFFLLFRCISKNFRREILCTHTLFIYSQCDIQICWNIMNVFVSICLELVKVWGI